MIKEGFAIQNTSDGHVPAFQYLTVGATAVSLGEALTLSSGKLVVCPSTTVPSYICMGTTAAAGTAPVIAVESDVAYGFVTSSYASFTVGSSYTIASTGLGCTTTTTNGVGKCVGVNTNTKEVFVTFK